MFLVVNMSLQTLIAIVVLTQTPGYKVKLTFKIEFLIVMFIVVVMNKSVIL